MTRPPTAGKMPKGGTEFADETITCDRCGDPATRSYEGSGPNFLNLCDGCYRALGRWLDS